MTTSSQMVTNTPSKFEGKIFGPTMLSNTHGDSASFEPNASITPIEAVRIAELFSLYTIAQHSGVELDFICFISEHSLYEHFILTELREDHCIPTVKPSQYYVGNQLIDLASNEFIRKYSVN